MMTTTKRLRKFSRDPRYGTLHRRKRLTATSLALVAAVERYRILPTSLLLRLVATNARVGQRHPQHLYHAGLVNRLALFGRTGRAGEFNYFLDSTAALGLLQKEQG